MNDVQPNDVQANVAADTTVIAMTTGLAGPAPEVAVTKDMVRRGLIVAPLLILVCGLLWEMNGALSSAYGIALVLVNFALAAAPSRVCRSDGCPAPDSCNTATDAPALSKRC